MPIISKKVFSLFKSFRHKQFIFVEPGGNFGDFLIYEGAKKLAKFLELEYITLTFDQFLKQEFSKEAVLYLHGSGGINPWYSGTPILFLEKVLSIHRGVIIVGPQTSVLDPDFLKNKIGKIFKSKDKSWVQLFFFAREQRSFEALKQVVPSSVELEIDHDTALNLESSDLVDSVPKGDYRLFAFREDKERIAYNSNLFSVCLDPIAYSRNFEQWLLVHARAKKIFTNRLHSAILSVILGKQVVLLPNNYHKNRSVWEYSLKAKGVEWRDSLAISSFSKIMFSFSFLNKIHKSYKINKVKEKIYQLFLGLPS